MYSWGMLFLSKPRALTLVKMILPTSLIKSNPVWKWKIWGHHKCYRRIFVTFKVTELWMKVLQLNIREMSLILSTFTVVKLWSNSPPCPSFGNTFHSKYLQTDQIRQWCGACRLQEYLQILITFREKLVLNFSTIAPTSASFIIFRDRLSQSFPAKDETGISEQLCFLQQIHFSSGRQTQSLLKISCSLLSLASGPQKSSMSAPVYCKASSYHWFGANGSAAEQLGCAYMII